QVLTTYIHELNAQEQNSTDYRWGSMIGQSLLHIGTAYLREAANSQKDDYCNEGVNYLIGGFRFLKLRSVGDHARFLRKITEIHESLLVLNIEQLSKLYNAAEDYDYGVHWRDLLGDISRRLVDQYE